MVDKSKIPVEPKQCSKHFELPTPSYGKPYRPHIVPIIKPTGKACKG